MIKSILIILACVPLYVANSFCDKLVSSKFQGRYNFIYNTIKFLICSICILPLLALSTSSNFEWGSLLCGVACGVMYAISKTIMLKGYERTSVAFMTLSHASGMIIPCIMGHFLWSEELGIVAIIGIVLAIISIFLLQDSKKEKKSFDKKGIIYGLIIFLTSGNVMVTQKMMGKYYVDQSVFAYNYHAFFVAFIILCLFSGSQKRNLFDNKDTKPVCLLALGSAISLAIICVVMTSLAKNVPSIILFPLFNGLGIIFVCVGSIFAFKEKLTLKKIIGLIIGIVGLALTNF